MDNSENNKQVSPRIRLNDGYLGEPIWANLKESTYYDPLVDTQCNVPVRSRAKLMKELEITE